MPLKQRTYLYSRLTFIEMTVFHAFISLYVTKVELGAQTLSFKLQEGSPGIGVVTGTLILPPSHP